MVLRRLSVFNGGFTLEAAEAVTVGAGIEAHHVLDLLSHLVDKSLVLVDDDRPEGRFRLLETVRQYAAGRLVESGEADPTRRAHLSYFFDYARWRSDETDDGNRERIRVDYDNFRGALQAARDLDDTATTVATGVSPRSVLGASRHLREAKEWLVDALGRASDTEPAARAHTLRALAHVRLTLGDLEGAAEAAEESVGLFRRLDDKQGLLSSLVTVGEISQSTSRGTTCQEEAVALAREIGDRRLEAAALITLGFALLNSDRAAARTVLEEAHRLANEVGAQHHERQTLNLLAVEALTSGRLEPAKAYLEEALVGLRSAAEGVLLSVSLLSWVGACVSLGDLDAARAGRDELASVTRQTGPTFASGAERLAAESAPGTRATRPQPPRPSTKRPRFGRSIHRLVSRPRSRSNKAKSPWPALRAEQLLTRLNTDRAQDPGCLPFQCNRDFALTILGLVERAEGNLSCGSARFHDALAAAATAGVPNQINALVGVAVDATDRGFTRRGRPPPRRR